MTSLGRNILFGAEAAGALLGYGLLRVLPMEAAAGLGAFVLGRVGPLLSLDRIADTNLRRAFPEKTEGKIRTIKAGMWRNLGRTLGEFAHLSDLRAEVDSRVEIVGLEHVEAMMRTGGPAVMLSAHMANWEILGAVADHVGLTLDMVYRAPNNPLISRLLEGRKLNRDSRMIPKGKDGAREIMRSMKERRFLGMLVDQKMNDGVEARFFGMPAMTAGAFAPLARRFGCPILMARIERLEGSRFRITVTPPLTVPETGDAAADQAALVQMVNDTLEAWIRERPEQWLWVHRRWPKAL